MNKSIFRQASGAWASLPYPGKGYKIAGSGCGCCAVTHVIIEADKYKNWTPCDVQPYMKQYATYGNGTKWVGIKESLKHYGMENVKQFDDEPMKTVFAELDKGGRKGVILFGSTKGPDGTVWTIGGHYIAFIDYKVENGLHWFYLKDSGGRKHDKWWCYEKSMRGDVRVVWSCTLPNAKKAEKKKTETKKTDEADKPVIDISYVQTSIDWNKAKSEIRGAIIRCGYRGYGNGALKEDDMFKKHVKGAKAAGVPIGVYFFTEAINAAEGKEEAAYVLNLIKREGIKPAYPIAIDTEAINAKGVRANNLSKAKRTEAIKAFCEEIKKQGYEPMIYASTSWLNNQLDMSKLPYKVWVAQYYDKVTYKGAYVLWQYTSTGKVSGINGVVDKSHCYIKENAATPSATTTTKATKKETTSEPTREEVIAKMKAWAKKIAADNTYHYKLWKSGDAKTKECPVCKKYPIGAHHGWNCIGFAFAVWHHGGGLKSKCNCHVVSNDTAEKIAKAKTDAEALKIAKKYIGLDCIEVIRNAGKNVAKSKWEAGDIGMMFNGDKYTHTFFIYDDEHVADSTGSSGKTPNDKQIAVRSNKNYSARILIRWTGGKTSTYKEELPSTKLNKTNAEVIADAIKWAKWIAADNSFHYGHGKDAHHNGCYFCGTQPKSKKNAGIVDYEKTYCCNPFVGAAWAHGGCIPKAMELCKRGSSWAFSKGHGYDKSSLFTNLGHPDKAKLKPGDVLCRDTHVAMYIGGGKIIEAGNEDDNKRNSDKWNKSIRIRTLSDADYKKFPRVHRFNGSVDTTCCIFHGEVSKRVMQLQQFLKWDGYNIAVDSEFGDATLKALKDFQKKAGITADGIVGPNTISAMRKVVK